LAALRIEPGTSGTVARNFDHETTEAVKEEYCLMGFDDAVWLFMSLKTIFFFAVTFSATLFQKVRETSSTSSWSNDSYKLHQCWVVTG
jgi:hypothetical protein